MNFHYMILTITHTHKRTHTLTHALTRVHTTRTCHHRKKPTDKPINKLANKTLSLLFWAFCLSVAVVTLTKSFLIGFFPNSYHHQTLVQVLIQFFFCQTMSKKAVRMAATTGLSNLVIIIRFLRNFIYGLLPLNSLLICS